jgi:hypothetical protein
MIIAGALGVERRVALGGREVYSTLPLPPGMLAQWPERN